MNVLVDTSVWVSHFRIGNTGLMSLIASDFVLGHPLVLAEIACGTQPLPRERTLSDLALLRQASQASIDEVIAFIEREKLYGCGCGFVDLSLLASVCLTPQATLWTLDRQLGQLASRFGVSFEPTSH